MKPNPVVAIIPARGGSKGVPKKNLRDFCGRPLLAWSIELCLAASKIDSVWVSSDCDEILAVAQEYGAQPIKRPEEFASDTATSESAWLHGIDWIESKQGFSVGTVLALQATSPIREAKDLDGAVELFQTSGLDSLFSASRLDDFFIWERSAATELRSVNYDYKNRKRRQDLPTEQFVENGSFYMFRPELLRSTGNRLGGSMGVFPMEFWKCFEINTLDDFKLCSAVMAAYLL